MGVLNSFLPGDGDSPIKEIARGFCQEGGMVRLGID